MGSLAAVDDVDDVWFHDVVDGVISNVWKVLGQASDGAAPDGADFQLVTEPCGHLMTMVCRHSR